MLLFIQAVTESQVESGFPAITTITANRITESDPSVTDYVLEQPAKCPNCRREVLEKTLIEPA
jgi:hypothetical protein